MPPVLSSRMHGNALSLNESNYLPSLYLSMFRLICTAGKKFPTNVIPLKILHVKILQHQLSLQHHPAILSSLVSLHDYFKSSPLSTQTSTLHILSSLLSVSDLTICFIKKIETNRQELPQLSNNSHSFTQYLLNTTGYLGSGTRSPTFLF